MKRVDYLILVIVLFLYACEEDTNVQPEVYSGPSASDYFPGEIGTEFNYSFKIYDSEMSSQIDEGTRISVIEDSETVNGTPYMKMKNSINLNSLSSPLQYETLYRTTKGGNSGIYFFIDTSNISFSFPDSLIQEFELTFNSDKELILFSNPLYDGKEWTAFQFVMSSEMFNGISLSVFEVKADYDGQLEITPGYLSEEISSKKITYHIIISMPNFENPVDFTDPENPKLNVINTEYSISLWFVEGEGIVKSEGNLFAYSLLNGFQTELQDTSKFISEDLVTRSIIE
ncbi:MAG: hypothetical protein K9J16_03695 [Melioribacteraceae bacterium]|nr:hypothetical protein [Melioribacteraceae bacterium]MCF8356180.1 hypothetical protein [Melioribacteraceae bacterium]MCF8394751.1 hypothetical protein [Melioribacteraceae bacterium]MCF8417949.1 hypothetical protein [Melioribacteraceae bacterium]